MIETRDERPNVVTEEVLRGFLAGGYLLELVCTQTAERRHNTWYGTWMARAVTEDGRHAMRLVTSRSILKTREFKTIVGLVSFLAEMGCTTARIPLKEGGCERHAAPGQLVEVRAVHKSELSSPAIPAPTSHVTGLAALQKFTHRLLTDGWSKLTA